MRSGHAKVFARKTSMRPATAFIDGFTHALWVGAAFSSAGIVGALLLPGRRRVIRGEASLVLGPQLRVRTRLSPRRMKR